MNKRNVSQLQVLEFALEGVTLLISRDMTEPKWSTQEWDFHCDAQKEIERRIRAIYTTRNNRQRTRVPA